MPGIHCLEHIDGLRSPDLAHDDPVGPHTKRVDQQHALRHGAGALYIRGTGLETHAMRLTQLKLRGVLDRDDSFCRRNRFREDVQQSGLTGTRPARNEHVEPGPHDALHQLEHGRSHGLRSEQIRGREHIPLEFPDRHMRPVDRQRRNDRVDTGTVWKSGVHHGGRIIDPPPYR